MVIFPTCKINLGLHVVRKREDGYHDLETVFYPLPLKDVLEIVPSTQFRFNAAGLAIPGDPGSNLCIRAYGLLKKDFPGLGAVDTWLYKQIPTGAGLGGGSSDGAAMLRLLNTLFDLGLQAEQLVAYALQLGSDCPFFLMDKPCFAQGRGEQLEPMTVDLSDHAVVLIHPGIHISTAMAFAELVPRKAPASLKSILSQPVASWRENLKNDFEEPLFRKFPLLREIKEKLYAQGAVYASMTGSGSAFYGLFPKNGMDKGSKGMGNLSHLAGIFPGYFFRIL